MVKAFAALEQKRGLVLSKHKAAYNSPHPLIDSRHASDVHTYKQAKHLYT